MRARGQKWVKSADLALHCKLPVYPSEPTNGGTASTIANGQLRTHALQQTRVITVGSIVTSSFFAALQNILIL
jgi:hypothetical protein